eukprot:scpid104317/ scgid27083/ 
MGRIPGTAFQADQGHSGLAPSRVRCSKPWGCQGEDDNYCTDEPQHVPILLTSKQALLAAGYPSVLPLGGLSEARRDYLYKQVRPHVPEAFQDGLCPKPDTPHLAAAE